MKKIMMKSSSEIFEYDYSVCEIVECKNESVRLAATETRMVDFCQDHYNIYILEME